MQQLEDGQNNNPFGNMNILAPPQTMTFAKKDQFTYQDNNNQHNQQSEEQLQQTTKQPKFQPLQEYHTADLAEKLLEQIQTQKFPGPQSTNFNKFPSLSQQFSKLFQKEIANISQKNVNQDETQKENIVTKDENNQNMSLVPEQVNVFAEQEKYESILQRLKDKLSNNYNFDDKQDATRKQSDFKGLEKKDNKNKSDISMKSSLTFNANKNEVSRYEQALSQEMKKIPTSRRTLKKPSNLQQLLEQQQIIGPLTKYKQLFLINEQDNEKARKLKILHQNISELLRAEYKLEINVKILQERIFSEYIPSLNASQETEKELAITFQNILYLWEMTNAHLESRQSFLEEMFNEVKQVSEIKQKLKFEQEYLENMRIPELEQQLLVLLNQRHQFKGEIDTSSESVFSYKSNKRFYNAIRNVNLQIEHLVQKYQHQKKTPFIWRGIKVDDILQVDKFEEDVVQKEELREEIQKRIYKKF